MKKIILVFLLLPTLAFANDSVIVTQYDGDKDCNYIIDASGIAKIVDVNEEPDRVYKTGIDVKRAFAFGQSDILIFTNDAKIYSFNTIIKKLRELERPPQLTIEMDSTLTEAQAIDIFGASVAQHDGFENRIYIVDANGITKIRDVGQEPEKVYETGIDVKRGIAFGQADIAIFTKDGTIYSFNTIIKVLRPLERPADLTAEMESTLTAKQAVELFGNPKPDFGILNYSILGIYLAALVGMGFYFSKSEKSTEDFFLGGRRIPAWAAGLSIFGTSLSAITFMALPAKVYATNWFYFLNNMGVIIVAAPITAIIFIPFFSRLKITTAYEYLEMRFSLAVRLFGSFVFIIMQLLRMGVVLYLPAIALSTVTGIDVTTTILLMGVLSTVYTVMGGIKAVIWTDVLQVIVLLFGAILCVIIIIFDMGSSFVDLTGAAFAQGKFSLGDMRIDFTAATVIVVLFAIPANFTGYVSDQTVVQRYLTTRDEKQAKKSLWVSAWMTVPASLIFFSLGTVLFIFYSNNPGSLDLGMKTDSVFPLFILHELPAGVSGLLIAGVFAASMSSLDSSMNSAATAIVTDFILRFKPSFPEHRRLPLARILTIILGVFGTVTALVLASGNIKSIWDSISMIISPFGGALGGLFLLGAVTKRGNAIGGLCGIICGVGTFFIIQLKTPVHFLLYTSIAVAVTFVAGYIISVLTGGNKKDITGLALGTMVKS